MTDQPSFTFKIDRNKRHQIQVEEIVINEKGKVTSKVLFSREYEQANRIVESILSMQPKSKDISGLYGEHVERLCVKDNKSGRNNILLFTGPRGGGKTSAVTSFGRYLENNLIRGFKLKCLPMIDPSYFDNNNNILKLVLTTMFKMAKCKIFSSSKDGDTVQFGELWKHFNNAFKILGDMEQDKVRDYTLETLNDLGDATNLRETMQRLVNEFIFRVYPEECDCLVLMIDDLDMNVAYAAQMLEQIRKFLMLDKLIILVAANLDQLQNEMREFYSKAFQQTLKSTNETLSVDVEDLSTRYLLKVFPASRRIHLSNIADHLIETLLLITDSGISKDEVSKDNGEYENQNLQQVVLTMIWKKTRLLFVPKDTNLLHPIIPSNLRDLSQFLNFLLDMETVKCDATTGKLFKDKESYTLCQHNLTQFKNYFLNNWIPENLNYEEEMMFENTPQDVSEINKHFINAINVIGTKNKKRLMSREVDLEQIIKYAEDVNIDRDIYTMVSPNDPKFVKANKISDIFNQPSNYSYGDLLLMIDKYETYFESEEARRFINAVKIYYSIILFETMFFKSVDVKYSESDLKNVKVDTIIPIQRLLGGTVYYPNYFEIITSVYFKQKGPSFDAKRAFYHKFIFEKDEHEEGEDNETIKIPDKIDLERLLFFVLYYGDVRPDRYDQKHTYDTTYNNDAYVGGSYYATFDILSLLNNALNPIQTALRANDVVRINNNGFFEKMSQWSDICSTDDIFFSNAILPFYSVDMMTKYLRKSYDAEEIIEKINSIRWLKNDIADRKSLDFVLDFDNLLSRDYVYDIGKQTRLLRKLDFDVTDVKILMKKTAEVLVVAREQYDVIMNKINKEDVMALLDEYKNYVIQQVLVLNDDYPQKSIKQMIRNIHECQSIVETYKYLKDALWKDMIMERVVRRGGQEQIRRESSIHNYYDKLWELTKQAINRISISKSDGKDNPSEVMSVYDKIYKTGVEVFIEGK